MRNGSTGSCPPRFVAFSRLPMSTSATTLASASRTMSRYRLLKLHITLSSAGQKSGKILIARNDKNILTNDKSRTKLADMNKAPSAKRGSTVFLQAVIVFIGIGALALMLWEPHLEGR